MKHALSMRLQRVESSELVEFPETEEGYLGKVARLCTPEQPTSCIHGICGWYFDGL